MVAGALVVGIAACGDDDDDDGGDGAAAATAYCADLVDFNRTVLQTNLGPESTDEEIEATADEVVPYWEAMRDSAPDALSDELAPLGGAIEALDNGDAEPFNADETFEQYTALISSSLEVCDFETVSVEAGDYWFKGVPDDLKAGTVAVEFTNISENEMHEFVVFKKNDPAQSALDLLALDEADAEEAATFAGATFAPSGESGAGLMELESGSYFAVCFVPIGSGDEGEPHFTAGQVTEFSVS